MTTPISDLYAATLQLEAAAKSVATLHDQLVIASQNARAAYEKAQQATLCATCGGSQATEMAIKYLTPTGQPAATVEAGR